MIHRQPLTAYGRVGASGSSFAGCGGRSAAVCVSTSSASTCRPIGDGLGPPDEPRTLLMDVEETRARQASLDRSLAATACGARIRAGAQRPERSCSVEWAITGRVQAGAVRA